MDLGEIHFLFDSSYGAFKMYEWASLHADPRAKIKSACQVPTGRRVN